MNRNQKMLSRVVEVLQSGAFQVHQTERSQQRTTYTIYVDGIIPIPLEYRHKLGRKRTEKQALKDYQLVKDEIVNALLDHIQKGLFQVRLCELYKDSGYRSSNTPEGMLEAETLDDWGYVQFLTGFHIPATYLETGGGEADVRSSFRQSYTVHTAAAN